MADFNDSLFVFRDEGGRRWTRLRLFLLLATLLLFLGTVFFVRYLITTPHLQQPAEVQQLRNHLSAAKQVQGHSAGFITAQPLWLRFSKARKQQKDPLAPAGPLPAPAPDHAAPPGEVRLGFYVGWDPGSYDSLRAHAGELTHVSPEWLTVVDGEGKLRVNPDRKMLEVAEDNHLVVLPLLNNLVDNTWEPEAVEGLINGPPTRQEDFISTLLQHLDEADAGGILIDWNELDPAYRQSLTLFLSRLATALHAREMQLWLCIPMGLDLKTFDLEALAPVVDRFVAMLHDENSESDPPGPIASQPWFEGWLRTVLGYGHPGQWITAIGAYGYDWTKGRKKADAVGFADALSHAGRAGLQECRSETPSYNPHFSYMDGDTEHEVWFLDGITFLNQMRVSRDLRAGGIAISRLGTEDPALWQALALNPSGPVAAGALNPLRTLLPADAVAQVGKGNFLTIEDSLAKGYREVEVDSTGQATTVYRLFPTYRTIVHQGKGQAEEVAISFDDGPDQNWTPAILDILKAKGVKGSFFMVGERMEEHPALVQRILREGHDIGVHTYTHPNLAEVSGERARLELNATQRLMETITGHSTFLFRPPYHADSQPHAPDELTPVQIAQALGYLTVASDIDPEDWSQPGVDTIVQRVKEQRPWGNIILLHDAGGDRGQTIEALPLIIDYLKTRGDRIVSLGQLLGIPVSPFMQPLPKNQQSFLSLIGNSGFRLLHVVGELCWAFMIVATVLVTLRTLLVALLAQFHRCKPVTFPHDGTIFQPPITIVLAAYNEEKVIGRTLDALLQADYPGHMELIVIDDGSNDRTAAVVTEISGHDSRIRLLRQENRGKARALRVGFQAATHEIIVTLDADTIFQQDTISILVRAMRDQKIGAVSGRVQVGNQQSLVARFQALEYTCGFNLDRRAYQQLNCITVVPGAASAWRKSAVMAAGGISSDTLAEDTDLTLSLHRAGYRIGYAPQAVAWTEAPETYGALLKQRFRWAFGTLQCLWKHRDLVGNPRYKALGWFSLPAIWFFQILLVAIGPVVDGFLLFSLFFGLGSAILFYLLIFLVMDLLLAALACRMEGEPLRYAWRIVPMRFLYRPLLAWVVWKSIIRAAKGALVGWGKLERTASSIIRT
ncbi:MAG: glycosyltransferase [Deltaproteobacteria bacterium]|nr:glycosyltransferase [Deltaproteobacteria bacterium]